MPLDAEEDDLPIKKVGLKQISSKKSIFDADNSKKNSKEDFDRKVEDIHKKTNDYKAKAADLALAYKKLVLDKTLPQNKNVFLEELEKETLTKMVSLAVEINNDENEQEGMGTMGWVTLLLKYFLHHRDRINTLEYSILQLQKNNEELNKKIKSLISNVDNTSKGE